MSARIIVIQKLMDKITVVKNTIAYSDVYPFGRCTGTAVVLLASTAGTITVSQQCSLDYDSNNTAAATWYDPVDASAGALGAVAAGVTVTTGRYVSYSPVMVPYIRYKVTETGNIANTVISLTLAFQEETKPCR